MIRCRISLSVLAFILVSLLLLFLNDWTKELWDEKAVAAINSLWDEKAVAAINSFLPLASHQQKITKSKKATRCSVTTLCSTPSELQALVTGTAAVSCPSYFNWIHHDLKPWESFGITVDIVEASRASATFTLMIVQGRLFIEFYGRYF